MAYVTGSVACPLAAQGMCRVTSHGVICSAVTLLLAHSSMHLVCARTMFKSSVTWPDYKKIQAQMYCFCKRATMLQSHFCCRRHAQQLKEFCSLKQNEAVKSPLKCCRQRSNSGVLAQCAYRHTPKPHVCRSPADRDHQKVAIVSIREAPGLAKDKWKTSTCHRGNKSLLFSSASYLCIPSRCYRAAQKTSPEMASLLRRFNPAPAATSAPSSDSTKPASPSFVPASNGEDDDDDLQYDTGSGTEYTPSLFSLPPELHLLIASYLIYPDALSLKHTNRHFYHLVDTGIKLKIDWLVERRQLHLECPNNTKCDLGSDLRFCRGSVRYVSLCYA